MPDDYTSASRSEQAVDEYKTRVHEPNSYDSFIAGLQRFWLRDYVSQEIFVMSTL